MKEFFMLLVAMTIMASAATVVTAHRVRRWCTATIARVPVGAKPSGDHPPNVQNNRNYVGSKRVACDLRATRMRSTSGIERTQLLSACLGAARAAFDRFRYSFISAKAALRSHNAKAARSSNAGAEGVVGRHL